MSKIKKIVGVMLAVIMAMSLTTVFSISSYAADGSITINKAVEGETYSIYKMLDLSYNSASGSYLYTVDSTSDWYDFFKDDTYGAYTYVSYDSSTGEVKWTAALSGGSQAAAFAKLATAYITAKGLTADDSAVAGSSGVVEFTGLEYGYYLISSTVGTLCALDSTDPSITIDAKNAGPSVKKEVEENSTGDYGTSNNAGIGDTVNYKSEISNAYGAVNVVLHDTLSEGLTLDKTSFVITSGTSTQTEVDTKYYTITYPDSSDPDYDGCTFEISFTDEFTSSVLASGHYIRVTYSATVNENAVIDSTGNENETYISYGQSSKSTESQTITYVYDMYIYKYSDTVNDPLAGAKFILYRGTVGAYQYAIIDKSTGTITGWTSTRADATEVESGTTGLINIAGLDAGTYYLEETEAPSGYNMLGSAITVVIDDSGTITSPTTTAVTISGTDYDTIGVQNSSGDEMPATGGMGTKIFYTLGGLLVLCAGVLLITKRRMGR
ncbi:MAG: isopeptide-forming domain-containing fimbrial protein [Clostridiales bacterium]|nr:isopeptide-forming domain-containing fimbrial protein [Clostridiales bacterium]